MEFNQFLKETAPLLGLQPRPFLRRGIKRRIEKRMAEMELSGWEAYLSRIKETPGEKRLLSRLLTVTISRFFRDREVFGALQNTVIPAILEQQGERDVRVWSIGCASGEEPYSLSMLWKENFEPSWSRFHLSVLGTDIDDDLIKRAGEGRYKESSVRDMPRTLIEQFFERSAGFYLLARGILETVEFRTHDILREEPLSDMNLIFCRNLAFTYFSKEMQVEVLKKIFLTLRTGGYLVIGKDEELPLTYPTLFIPVIPKEKVYQKLTLKA